MRALSIVFLLIIVLLGAGGYYTYNFISNLKPPELIELSNEWGEITEKTSTIHTKIVINNPNPINLSIGNLGVHYTIKMNNIALAEGFKKGFKIKEGRNVIELTTKLNNAMIPEWFKSHINRGEETTVKILPEVTLNLFATKLKAEIPEKTQTIKTDLLASLNSKEKIQIKRNDITIVEIRERKASWGRVSDDKIPLDIILSFYNPNPVPISIPRIDYSIQMNDIVMVEGTSKNPAILAPKQETNVYIETYLNSNKLDDWWVTHLKNGEFTKIDAKVDVMLNIGDIEVPIKAIECTSGLQTDILNPEGETKSTGPECAPPEIVTKTTEWLSSLTEKKEELKKELKEEIVEKPKEKVESLLPQPKDSDGDGISDDVDKCPHLPETYNDYEDEDGCPDVKVGTF